jgi:hypothetical protein
MPTESEIFHSKFCRGIRVAFNWRRLFVEGWPITIHKRQDSAIFSTLKLPWYLANDGFVSFDAPGALPVRLGDIEKWYPLLPERQRNDIDNMKGEFLSGARATDFEFPVYAMPKDEYLVMDGNHRLSALALAKLPFAINMWVVHGPIDTTALADLTHIVRDAQCEKTGSERNTF